MRTTASGPFGIWEACVKLVLRKYPFEILHLSLTFLSETVEKEGYTDAADKLAREFQLIPYCDGAGRAVESVPLKRKGGRVVLKLENNKDCPKGRISALEAVRRLVESMEAETEAPGLAQCLDRLALQEKELPRDDWTAHVASRTKVCAGEPVEAVFFKQWIEFRFDDQTFEAFLGFVRTYTTLTVPSYEITERAMYLA